MKVRINDNNYDLTDASIMWYKDFEDYTKDDVIDVSNLELNDKYKATNKLFNNIYNDIAGISDDNDNFLVFGSKVREIDELQKFLFDKKEVENAIKYLENGITYMLTFYKELLNENVEEKKR